MDETPYTSAEFHNDVQKQVIRYIEDVLSEQKMLWSQVEPFLNAARGVCRDDFVHNGRLTLHGTEVVEGAVTDAEEAFLAISVRDREDEVEWLSQTYWVSDIALISDDPAQVREATEALERTVAKLREWLRVHAPDDEGEPLPVPEA